MTHRATTGVRRPSASFTSELFVQSGNALDSPVSSRRPSVQEPPRPLSPAAAALQSTLGAVERTGPLAPPNWRLSPWPETLRALPPAAALTKFALVAAGADWAAGCSRTMPAMAVAAGFSGAASLISLARVVCGHTEQQRARQMGIGFIADGISLAALLIVIGRTQMDIACGAEDPSEIAVSSAAMLGAALTLAQGLCCCLFQLKAPLRQEASIEVVEDVPAVARPADGPPPGPAAGWI
ncbi:hypothetical protein JI739_13235 [Ramlibacter sp. AW1]|uniref:Uncharacterized protein n=1 Tax=Ramlibacter aurantiacus TaxID=2801330 RepID=A0A936ZI36_9BURK|nr:hypothetical protein [Ramlibacter aurantiacus]MBL0421317.1 hypothetical protein [Ramlibacter aurantiacus]